jgi:hypothetical protein
MSEYPLTSEKHPRRFQSYWFKSYPWLEYSEKNTVFCFPNYLFSSEPSGKSRSNTFTVKGFNCWKKVNDGERCVFFDSYGKMFKFSSLICYQVLGKIEKSVMPY